jgi:hypothetical protein
VVALCFVAPLLSGCYGLYGNDEFERYAQRHDGVTMDAGNAKNVNAVTMMNHPWPPGVTDRRLITEASRVVPAVERYRVPPKQGGPNPAAIGAAAGAAAAAAAGAQEK